MPSPFPGMNPYFEQDEVWHDFHQTFVTQMRDSLVGQVGGRYIVKLVLRGVVCEPAHRYGHSGVAADTAEESSIEIRKTESRQLVATIELLSPANRYSGPDREAYLSKRRQCLLAGNANFVELDLLRGGPRLPLDGLPRCDYYALVARAERRPDVGVWPIQLRDPLPVISVPLLSGDADARLDLQQLLHSTYDKGGYENYIYESSPSPILTGSEAEWAAGILARVAGTR